MPSKSQHAPHEGLLHPQILFAVRFFTAAALGLALYLLWISLSGMAVAGCGPDSGCDKVLHSRWAYWLGVPVSVAALVVYGMILVASFRLGRNTPPAQQRLAWRVLIPCAILVMGAALWFSGVQVFVIRSLCPLCMTAHGCGALAALMLLWNAPIRRTPEKPWQQEKQVYVAPALGTRLSLVPVVALAVLIAGQTLHQPRSHLVKMFDGQIEVNLREVPVLGNPAAPHAMISLFDYTCHHCRLMHGHLKEALRSFSNHLAIVSLPMPFDPQCNYTVKRVPPEHTNACEYARIGLAVWRARARAMAEFDDWVFAPPSPPPLSETRKHAGQLVGPEAFEKALQDPWINEQIQRDVAIYATNYFARHEGSMPQLIIGTNLVTGTLRGAQDLYPHFEKQFGLKLPRGMTNQTASGPRAGLFTQ